MISIILINYDGLKYLPRCFEAIRKQSYRDYEIIVVNNRSTDGSLEYLREQSDIVLIDPGVNTGFSRGQNLGILASRGDLVLCLNFDCFLEPDFLQEVEGVFASRPEIGAVSGKLLKLINGGRSRLLDSTGISFHCCMPADRGEQMPDDPVWDEKGFIFGPSGAAACYRRKALESVRFNDEFFDEDFFIYCEDIDLAWRLNLEGWGSWYHPAALAYHERGSTRKECSWEKRNYFILGFRNRYLAMYKNLRWREDICQHWSFILWHEMRFMLSWSRGGIQSFVILLIALMKLVKMVLCKSRLRKKRRFIQSRIKNSDFSLGWGTQPPRSLGSLSTPYFMLDPALPRTTLFQASGAQLVNVKAVPRLQGEQVLASGCSKNTDPQIIVEVPESAPDTCWQLLEFDLFLSDLSDGQIIWRHESKYCISHAFPLKRGRHTYLLDLKKVPLANEIGDTGLFNNVVTTLRLDPALSKGIEFQLFSLRLCRNATDVGDSC